MKTSNATNRLGLAGLVAAVCLIAASGAAFADAVRVNLSGDMEVPPVKTMATGSGTLTIGSDMSVSGRIATSGLDGTMAHIHTGAVGKNGPVIVHLSKDGDNGWMVPPGARFTAEQYQAYKAGELYLNVHTTANKGGEIRGQLTPQ